MYNISVSSEALSTVELSNFLQMETGKLFRLVKKSKRSDEKQNVRYKIFFLVRVWRLKITTENLCFVIGQHDLSCFAGHFHSPE